MNCTWYCSLAGNGFHKGDINGVHYDAEIEVMNLILLSIPNDIYNSVDASTSAKTCGKDRRPPLPPPPPPPENFSVSLSGEPEKRFLSPDLFDPLCHAPPTISVPTPQQPPPLKPPPTSQQHHRHHHLHLHHLAPSPPPQQPLDAFGFDKHSKVAAVEVVRGRGDVDEGGGGNGAVVTLVVVLEVVAAVEWGRRWWVARGIGDRIDRVIRNVFGVRRKGSPKSFLAAAAVVEVVAGGWPAVGMRGGVYIMGYTMVSLRSQTLSRRNFCLHRIVYESKYYKSCMGGTCNRRIDTIIAMTNFKHSSHTHWSTCIVMSSITLDGYVSTRIESKVIK
nr:hypothetical protein [Tanacetum cinerariifolium]